MHSRYITPVMYIDPSGEDWWHWGVAVGAVVLLAFLTVVSCGGFAAAYGAIVLAGNGIGLIGLSSTATILSFATAGSALALGASVIYAGLSSSSWDEFANYGSTGLIMTSVGGVLGALAGYEVSRIKILEFPSDHNDFNPKGLTRYDYKNGEIIKWQEPGRGKAVFEHNWGSNPHYHITPDGVNRMINPFTGDTHMYPGDPIPFDFWNYFN